MPAPAFRPAPTIVADLVGPTAVPELELAARAARSDGRLAPPSSETLPETGLRERPRAARPPDRLRPGMVLGDYELVELLGTGATAAVWRAVDRRLHMPIALKLFDPRGRGGRAVLDAVMREARAASRVVSDHVVRVKDAGHFPEVGLGFIAMELCAGLPDDAGPGEGWVVGRALDRDLPRSPEEAIRLVAEAARGVADAHREGVFHRDVKPANILVRPGSRRAQISDFGLTVAELEAGAAAAAPRAPGRRVVLGTPDYMAPEAARGLPAHLDPVRDRRLLVGLDVYGLGATLYALFAGHPPYRRSADERVDAAELIRRVRAGPPPPLESLPSPRLRVGRQVARVVARAMARDPADRYPSADALADDLEAILAHRPTSRDARDRALRLRLFLRRNRAQVAAAVSLGVLVFAIAGTAVVGARLRAEIAAAETRIAELAEQRAALEGEVERQGALAAAAQRRAEEARAREAEARRLVASTEDDLDAARRRVLELLRERDEARTEADDQRARAEAAEQERDEALARASDWRARALVAEQERDAARAEARDWQVRAADLQLERDEARKRLGEAERRLAALEDRVAGLRGELDAARRAREAAEASAARMAARVRRLERELESARAETAPAAPAAPAPPAP